MKSSLSRFLQLLIAVAVLAPAVRAVPGVTGPAPKEAWLIPVKDDWKISGALPENAFLIGLQGLANTDAPRVYIEYPETWHFHDFNPLKDFYAQRYGIKFTRLATPEAALAQLGHFAKGYVVWDRKVRPSLNVAFTAAGVLRAVVVDESLIPLAEKHGLKPLADFRGKFTGQTDLQIYRWAYNEYWSRCSRDYLIWMGGVAGDTMEPGVADLAIAFGAFVTDLSANPRDTAELAFHKEILAQMKPTAWIMGWHSYAKDTEGQWVTLTSTFGLKVIGLNTFPNGTFMSQIGFSPGFKLTNSNHVTRQSQVQAEKKVYICLVQSDSMGIGAWTQPERGQIPYNWEVGVDGAKWYPAAMEMFSKDKTPNDYFIGGQSGYMYPAAVPADRFPGLMREMNELMPLMDEHTVTIMDHTDRGIPIGYFDLPKRVVDEYYANVPDTIGFINGYAAAHTFDLRNGQAFMSYDYYLDEHRPEASAIADLDELARLNPVRPYFLLLHVRESNSIKRVMSIMNGLEEKPEIVPLDTFLKLAASKPTFKVRYKDERPATQPWDANTQ
ncbi:MAG TPA: GxGYxYP family putative glycoside hydrolase [Opitutaceae bacterium]|nr:GxGYxYP family putative glycoside hydrolase [Opitutaceae bacterium]